MFELISKQISYFRQKRAVIKDKGNTWKYWVPFCLSQKTKQNVINRTNTISYYIVGKPPIPKKQTFSDQTKFNLCQALFSRNFLLLKVAPSTCCQIQQLYKDITQVIFPTSLAMRSSRSITSKIAILKGIKVQLNARRVSFTGHIPQVTGIGHSNCAPKRNMFLLKIYIRACLVLLALSRLFLCCFGANIELPVVVTCGMWPAKNTCR